MAVIGSESYANLHEQLLSWEACEPLVAEYCEEAGLPASAGAFTAELKRQLTAVAAKVDAGYPDNADLTIDKDSGKIVLSPRRGKDRRTSAQDLEREILKRLPEWSLLDVLARTAYWLSWWRHFGPVSGSDPKIRDKLARYVLTVFCYGTNAGPAQVARHMRQRVSVHELSLAGNQHITTGKLNMASADVIDMFIQLDLAHVWGDVSKAGVDGSQIDTWENNLLAETSIRYGGYGGIAYRHISDTYIALFSHFIPCGVWEAVYLFEGLLKNESEVTVDIVHGDTQGQSLPVFGLAHMLGIQLLPRIRNWKDLTFYRPTPTVKYQHIGPLFGDPDKDVINWRLIENHWPDLMRVVLSIREGRLSSAALLRKLGNESRRNRIYQADNVGVDARRRTRADRASPPRREASTLPRRYIGSGPPCYTSSTLLPPGPCKCCAAPRTPPCCTRDTALLHPTTTTRTTSSNRSSTSAAAPTARSRAGRGGRRSGRSGGRRGRAQGAPRSPRTGAPGRRSMPRSRTGRPARLRASARRSRARWRRARR
ncbi:Tn3 family transposase [Streptomyces sp. NPDC048551]|uniref:Tn3 family transposase n=1 Tax=Streptomyces sp. NPDC048551 TaxID=3155758 RepID=UPI003439F79B